MQVYKLKECGNVYLISNFKCGQIIMKRQDDENHFRKQILELFINQRMQCFVCIDFVSKYVVG